MQIHSARHRMTWFLAGKRKISKGIAAFLALSFVTSLGGIRPAIAAIEPYAAQVSPGAVAIAPGESKQITLKFKNVGTKTWVAGKAATSVYLYGNSSPFSHSTWLKNDQPSVIRESRVAPGAMASAVFSVTAPQTPGVYTERFLLSYAPGSWVKGSVVTVTFTVAKPAPAPVVSSTPSATDTVPVSTEWKASLVDKGGVEWQILPLDHSLVTVVFKNTGTKTWKRDGAGYVSLYTWSPKYRQSSFKDSAWKTDTQAATLVESEVKPGQTGTFRLELRAPEVPGKYQEAFQLAAEDVAWIDGGSVSFPIAVGTPDSYIAKGATPGATAPVNGTYSTVLLLASQKNIALPGNDRLQLTNGFKNNGTAVWNSRTLQLVGVESTLGISSTIRDDSWPSSVEAVKATGATAPGEIGFVTYTIKAPPKKGEYTARFKLLADGKEVDGGQIEIPITVTADGYVDPNPISIPGPITSPTTPGTVPPLSGDLSTLPNEPIIRVGLYRTTDDTLMVRSLSGNLLAQQNGVTVCTLPQGEIAKVVYERSTRMYKLTGSGCSSQSPGWFVMAAADGIAPLEITDYSRPVSWLPGANDNKFRAKLELRFAAATDAVWVINELPLETYLKGIAETSNVSPLEYQKALLTAARTYALYHVNRGTKHADEYFHVDAHLDQVYRGFGQEDRSPNIVQGVMATRGQIVTYDGKLAITPYFSRSDGRTRDWTEVWGGNGYPWLKAVSVPYDVGQTLWGHGVGLSARGALYMASKDNVTYDTILKHFYTGIELRQAYQ